MSTTAAGLWRSGGGRIIGGISTEDAPMILPIRYVHAGMGLAFIVLSIPLILRKVPMNHFYGVRIRKAFASRRNWYAINAYGGRLILAFGVFLLLFALLAGPWAPPPRSPWSLPYALVPLIGLVPVLAAILRFARRLPDR